MKENARVKIGRSKCAYAKRTNFSESRCYTEGNTNKENNASELDRKMKCEHQK